MDAASFLDDSSEPTADAFLGAADGDQNVLDTGHSVADAYAATAQAQALAAKQASTPGTVTNIAASLAPAVLPVGEGALALRAGMGAATGVASGVTGDPEHPVRGAVIGGVLGTLLPSLFGRTAEAAAAARASPVPLSAARAVENSPVSGGNWLARAASRSQPVVNNAIAQQIGEPAATKLTPDVLDAADRRLSAIFDNIRSPNNFYHADAGDISGSLAKINEQFTPADDAVLQNPTVQRLLKLIKSRVTPGEPAGSIVGADGAPLVAATPPDTAIAISTKELGDIESQLGKAAKTTIKNDYEKGAGLFQVQDYVRGLISEGLTPDQQALYNSARAQYRTLWGQMLRGNSGILNTSSGDVKAVALARYLQRTDPEGFALGRNRTPMYQVARLAAQQVDAQSLMENVQQTGGDVSRLIRAAAHYVPNAAAWVAHVGARKAATTLANRPGFLAALAAQGDAQAGQQP